MVQLPQVLLNVKVREPADPTESSVVRDAVGRVEEELGERGRVVLRASGTEPVIRVMVEGEDRHQVNTLAERLADSVRTAFGR
jgi:phosphoglucosamine mutase